MPATSTPGAALLVAASLCPCFLMTAWASPQLTGTPTSASLTPIAEPALQGVTASWVLVNPANGRSHAGGNARADEAFPLMSIFKFPLALSVLHRIQQNKLKLEDTLHVSPDQYDPGSWSPLARRHPQGGTLTVRELLRAAVAESDNNATDILLHLIGGPAAVQQDLNSWGQGNIAVAATEREMHADLSKIRLNRASAPDLARLLHDFYEGKILRARERAVLWEIMASTETGRNRLAAGLPSGSIFAHKTGTSDTDSQGRTAALGDIGIAVLPDGQALILVVLMKDIDVPITRAEACMADVARYAVQRMGSAPK